MVDGRPTSCVPAAARHPFVVALASLLAIGLGGCANSLSLTSAHGTSLRYYGAGVNDIDRVKIRIDDETNGQPGPPADIGATDITIELWLRAAAGNEQPTVECGANINWIHGNIFIDRDRYNQDRKFGLSLAGGRVVFGVSGDGTGDRTLCGTRDLRDGAWHHVAAQRQRETGEIGLFVDGRLVDSAVGPAGDISYPDDGVPADHCGGPCNFSDPFLVLGAEKHDAGEKYPSFHGWLDELRLSTVLRYHGDFTVRREAFEVDPQTAALYHFDEGQGDIVRDAVGASHGVRRVGGNPAAPAWSRETPFASGPD